MLRPPKTIMSGYPEKEFTFTGEWAEFTEGGSNRRIALRNKHAVWHPIYRSKDGDSIALATITRRKKP